MIDALEGAIHAGDREAALDHVEGLRALLGIAPPAQAPEEGSGASAGDAEPGAVRDSGRPALRVL